MAHTPKLPPPILLSGTPTMWYHVHIFVEDAVAWFQPNTNFHAQFAFFFFCCCKLVFSIDGLRFYKPCLFVLAASLGNLCNRPTISSNLSLLDWWWVFIICPKSIIFAYWRTDWAYAHTRYMNLTSVWLSGFIANSSPVLIKKLPQPWTSCWGNKDVIIVLNGLQLWVISTPMLKIFAFLLFGSGWVVQAVCLAEEKKKADKWEI